MTQKQSILGRISQLTRANINSLLDKAEDPEKMLDQLVRDYTNSIAEAAANFHRLHDAQYAHCEPHVTPEIVTVRCAATGRLAKPKPRPFDAPEQAMPVNALVAI